MDFDVVCLNLPSALDRKYYYVEGDDRPYDPANDNGELEQDGYEVWDDASQPGEHAALKHKAESEDQNLPELSPTPRETAQ